MPWVSSGMSATSSSSRVPPWARSKMPTVAPTSGPSQAFSLPNSSLSMRSGCMVAQLSTRKRPVARRERSCRERATISLPDPAEPVIRTRLPVGATFATACFSWFMAIELPSRSLGGPARRRSSSFSSLSWADSIARSTTSSRWSALKGFSMKS